MRKNSFLCSLTFLFLVLSFSCINGEDPYRFLNWNITYGDIWPLGVKQQGILINGQFPGPQIEAVTNENLIINVFNSLDEPFLISWNGIQQRRNSWQDGVYGTNCPIPPGQNFTYVLQVKDQIGSYFYFPSLALHKAAGGFGGFKIQSRSIIPIPFPTPAGEFTVLAGDWYSKNHTDLRAILDGGSDLPSPDGLLINGRGLNGNTFTVEQASVSGPPPGGPTFQIDWSLEQARSLRRNLTANGPRPNPQGSYHYRLINVTRTIRLHSTAPIINGKQRYAVNSVSFIPADTPLKLADYFKISGVFSLGSIPDYPTGGDAYLQTSVMNADFRGYAEVVFENPEDVVQSWHVDGHNFFVVGMDGGQWIPASRLTYNLRDTISRCTVQVYPKSWTAVYMPLDNVGMWNIRSENWARQYLGQQLYLRVYSPVNSWRDEYPIPSNALKCGRAIGLNTPPL
uniref:Uncharacterized protein n=1 Tax=Cucumis sativus TaxID=3659 RepID=A0A0A0K1K9_CUCSA